MPHAPDGTLRHWPNDSDFGLAGSVWNADDERGEAIAKQIRTGSIGVNGYLPDTTSPFGGMKSSGLVGS